MKAIHCIFFCFLFTLIQVSTAYAKLNIVTTTSDFSAVIEELVKEKAEVTYISKPTEDPHFVDAKPSFIVKLNKADLLVEGGLQLEIGWLPPLVEGARNKTILPGNPGYFIASTGIPVLQVPSAADRAMGDIHPFGNPHFMLDPLNGEIFASHVCDRLCRIDEANCGYYRKNLNDFRLRVDRKISEWQKMLEPFWGTKIVTYHKTFPYFAQRFGLEIVGTLEPLPGIPPSPTHINNLIPMMKKEGVKLILIESFRERRIPEFVAKHTGAKVVIVPIMVGAVRGAEDYVALFDYIVNQILSALGDKS